MANVWIKWFYLLHVLTIISFNEYSLKLSRYIRKYMYHMYLRYFVLIPISNFAYSIIERVYTYMFDITVLLKIRYIGHAAISESLSYIYACLNRPSILLPSLHLYSATQNARPLIEWMRVTFFLILIIKWNKKNYYQTN